MDPLRVGQLDLQSGSFLKAVLGTLYLELLVKRCLLGGKESCAWGVDSTLR